MLCTVLCAVLLAGIPQAQSAGTPFTGFRDQSPGRLHHITAADLPAPFATPSAGNPARMVARPDDAWPLAPPGFRVELFDHGLKYPRTIRVAPDGAIFVAESGAGRIRVYRGIGRHSLALHGGVAVEGLNRPYGIAFYPPGNDPKWLYIGDTDAVLRLPYPHGEAPLKAAGAEHIAALPGGGGHWTRDLAFAPDGKTLFVAVGSGSNIDDPDQSPAEHERADILAMDPDGGHRRVYASGIRNPSGLAVDPHSGRLWCTVNERDGLGDDLVPDYITPVRENGFYGWPWYYIGPHPDPRLHGRHPELRERTIVPDVLLQAHNASLQIAFYQGDAFGADYDGDLFATEHGSWNRAVRTGYEVIRVLRHHGAQASGEYEDFLTGFVLPDGRVWGRPSGVAEAPDGALLVSDDGSGSIWRVVHEKAP